VNNFEPLQEPWLEEFHINKYVKKTDHREFNRPNRSATENAGFRRLIEKERRRAFKDEIRVDKTQIISKV
jgi:hypothetical protein